MFKGYGLKRAQAQMLGVPWPIRSGWLKGLEGKFVLLSTYQKFLEAGKLRAPKKKRKRSKASKPLPTSKKKVFTMLPYADWLEKKERHERWLDRISEPDPPNPDAGDGQLDPIPFS